MKSVLLLFDVDGTLTKPRQRIEKVTKEYLQKIKDSVSDVQFGIVSGSDLDKLKEQIDEDFLWFLFDYICTENGLVSYYHKECIHCNSMINEIGESLYQEIVNDVLKLLSEIEIPYKRGTFIELRTGMLNVSPIGRSCTQRERDEFYEYDKIHHIRERIVEMIHKKYHLWVECSIGGQISVDIYPKGWNKSYCMKLLDRDHYEIYFFGDKMEKGGNDYELAIEKGIYAIPIKDPMEIEEFINEIVKDRIVS